jgi:hypothetical protein
MHSAKRRTAMKGIHTFTSQTEGLAYFTGIVIDAANRGSFSTDEVKILFRREVERWASGSAQLRRSGSDPDRSVEEFWGLLCLPILSFFRGVVEGGDNSMNCDFQLGVEAKKGQKLSGSLEWYGQATEGRFVRVVFADLSTRVHYDTGYNYGSGEPKGSSTFLSLPGEGDQDLSGMERDEFLKLAQEAK